MDKRAAKRHKREIARKRAKTQAKQSEPDVRTPDEMKAAREASRPAQGWHKDPHSNYSTPSKLNRGGSVGRNPSTSDG